MNAILKSKTEGLVSSSNSQASSASNSTTASPAHSRKGVNLLSDMVRYHILQYSQSNPQDLPRMTSLSSTGGWMTSYTACFARKVIMTSHATRRNGNVVRLDTSIFPMFTLEKYIFGTYRRKIINIYCPLVTEKSSHPRVKLTCPCHFKPRHGLS